MRILILQQEYLHQSRIKMWNYWCNLGIYEMLKSVGAHVDLVYIPHFKVMKSLIEFGSYDVIILNDIVHGLSGEGPVVNLDTSDMDFLSSLGVPLCGIAVESIFTYYNGKTLHDFAQRRLDILNQYLPCFSFFLATHVYDVRFFREQLSKPCMWLKPISFNEFEVASFGRDGELVFNGSLYPQRMEFLKPEIDQGLKLTQLTLPGEDEEFWLPIIKSICDLVLEGDPKITFDKYQHDIVSVNNSRRKKAELHLIKSLSRYSKVVHLPAFFQGCHPRVIQALQAGSLPLAPKLSGVESLWFMDDVDCIYYDPSIPFDLLNKSIDTEPGKSNEIIMNGRERNTNFRSSSMLGFEIICFFSY